MKSSLTFALSLLVSIQLGVAAYAQENDAPNLAPNPTMDLVEQNLFLLSQLEQGIFVDASKADVMTTTVLAIHKLPPADFNIFMLYLLNTYAQKPYLRPAIYLLVENLTGYMQDELATDQATHEGPYRSLEKGLTVWTPAIAGSATALILAKKAIAFAILAARARKVNWRLLFQLRQSAGPKEKWSITGTLRRVSTHPLTLSAIAGIGAGLLEHEWRLRWNTERMNPLDQLHWTQAQLSCNLSAYTVDLENDPNPDLSKVPMAILQAKELEKEWPDVDKLFTDSPDIRALRQTIPVYESFEALRSQMKVLDERILCREVRLDLVVKHLKALLPVDPEAPPTDQKPADEDNEIP